MRRNQCLWLGLGSLVALMAACDDGATTPPPASNTAAGTGGTAGTGTAGTPTATAGTGTTTGTAGTGVAGSSTAGTGAAGSSTAGTTATAGTGAAGMSVAGTGAAGATPGSTPGFAMCGGAPKTGECKTKAPGIYAMKTEVDVWYMDEVNGQLPLFDPGRSKITIYFRGTISDVCEDGSSGKALMHPCGTRLPPLYADVNGGVIQIEFPDELWDKPMIPDYAAVGSTTGFGVGDTLKISKTAGLVGIDLMAVDAAWPSYTATTTFACKAGTGALCFPDMDDDKNPGVTVNIKTDGTPPPAPYTNPLGAWHYIPAPTDLNTGLLSDGATKVYIGLRTQLGGSGKIGADCSSGVGSAEAENFESRVIDCVMKDGSKCTPDGSEFVDKNTPAFHVLQVGQMPPANWKHARPEADMLLDRSPSKGPQSSVIRLGDLGGAVTCAQVRGATFPPIP
jgi:hypothetical protein